MPRAKSVFFVSAREASRCLEVFAAYTLSYYEGGVSSVYLWDLDEGYAGAFLVRKELPGSGVCCAVHLVEVRDAAQSHYVDFKVSSSVTVHLEVRLRGG